MCNVCGDACGESRAARTQAALSSNARQLRPRLGGVAHQEVVGLAEQYCNDFICTSSPSVEPTVRTLASDVENAVDGRRTERVYSAEVSYKVREQQNIWHGSGQLVLSPSTKVESEVKREGRAQLLQRQHETVVVASGLNAVLMVAQPL